MVSVKLLGDAKLIKALGEMSKGMQSKVTRRSLRDGAKIFLDAIKTEAPKRSGWLRKSVKVKAMKRKKGRIGFSIGYRPTETGKFYYFAIEYGRRRFKQKGEKRKHRKAEAKPAATWVVPNPFVRRAFDKHANSLATKLPEAFRFNMYDMARKAVK